MYSLPNSHWTALIFLSPHYIFQFSPQTLGVTPCSSNSHTPATKKLRTSTLPASDTQFSISVTHKTNADTLGMHAHHLKNTMPRIKKREQEISKDTPFIFQFIWSIGMVTFPLFNLVPLSHQCLHSMYYIFYTYTPLFQVLLPHCSLNFLSVTALKCHLLTLLCNSPFFLSFCGGGLK